MSPAAIVLALVLHGATAAALWWVSPLRPVSMTEEPIQIVLDAPPPSSDAQETAQVASQPAPETQPQEAKPQETPQQALAPPEPPLPEPPKPEPPAPPAPKIEEMLPPPEPTPPPSAMDFPKPAPPPRPTPPPPRPTPPQRPTPAQPMPTPQAPPGASQAAPAPPMPPSNSADFLLGQTKTRDTYLNRLARHISQFRFYPQSSRSRNEEGRVRMRVTVARDGHLLDVKVDKSSGYPAIDAAELEAIRKAAPFPPLPLDIPGESVVFILPVTYELTLGGARR